MRNRDQGIQELRLSVCHLQRQQDTAPVCHSLSQYQFCIRAVFSAKGRGTRTRAFAAHHRSDRSRTPANDWNCQGSAIWGLDHDPEYPAGAGAGQDRHGAGPEDRRGLLSDARSWRRFLSALLDGRQRVLIGDKRHTELHERSPAQPRMLKRGRCWSPIEPLFLPKGRLKNSLLM
jgi:hypothetical protein